MLSECDVSAALDSMLTASVSPDLLRGLALRCGLAGKHEEQEKDRWSIAHMNDVDSMRVRHGKKKTLLQGNDRETISEKWKRNQIAAQSQIGLPQTIILIFD